MFILSQIINGIGTCLNIIGINIKDKNKTLILFALGNSCVATALGLLGAYAGMTIQIIFVIQTIINFFWEKKNNKYPLWLVFIYILVPTIILTINYQTMWDILPLLAGILFPLALISQKFFLRFLNLLSVVVWIPYNINFGQYVGAVSCTIFTIINIIAIIRFDVLKEKNNPKN